MWQVVKSFFFSNREGGDAASYRINWVLDLMILNRVLFYACPLKSLFFLRFGRIIIFENRVLMVLYRLIKRSWDSNGFV